MTTWLVTAAVLAFAPPDAPDEAGNRVVSDGPVAVTAKLSPDPSYIGDLLELEVVAAYPQNVSVNLPIGLSFDPLHLVGIEEAPQEATGEGLRKTFTIKLQYFDVGTGTIPAFPMTWVDESGEVHTLELPAHSFEVQSMLANEADPVRRDEDPPVSIVYPNTTAETVIYAVFGTALAGLILWIVARRYFSQPKPVYVPPPIPPHELALDALQELEQGELVQQGKFQLYYLQLTEIAKGYLEGRFGVEALDRTTDEIRRELLRDGSLVAPLSADDVIAFLQRCDLVKFARYAPPTEDAEQALGDVRQMVTTSMPAQAVPREAGPAKPGDGGAAEPEPSEAEQAEADRATERAEATRDGEAKR